MNILHDLLANPDVQGAIMTIILAVIGATIPPIVRLVIGLLTDLRRRYQYREVVRWVERAVRVAEQLGLTGQLLNMGNVKFTYALNLVQRKLDQAGYDWIDLDDIREEIEDALRRGVHERNTLTVETLAPIDPPQEVTDPLA